MSYIVIILWIVILLGLLWPLLFPGWIAPASWCVGVQGGMCTSAMNIARITTRLEVFHVHSH